MLIKVGTKYKCDDGTTSTVVKCGTDGSVCFCEDAHSYEYVWSAPDFAKRHTEIEPTPAPKPEHTEETRTALTRLERAAEIVRLLDGLSTLAACETLLCVFESRNLPLRAVSLAEYKALLSFDKGDPYAD